MEIQPIGYLRTPFAEPEGTPIQPGFARDCAGEACLDPAYREGLLGLAGFSHVWLIYGFHRQEQTRLVVKPFMAEVEVGVFATRAPARPNRLGLTLAKVLGVEAGRVCLSGLDMVDGSPLYDLKPFFGRLEIPESWCTGWLDESACLAGPPRVADKRFCEEGV